MQLTRISATLGACALGAVLVASTTGVGTSATVHHQRPAHVRTAVHHRFVVPAPNKFDPKSALPMGLHCGSGHMDM